MYVVNDQLDGSITIYQGKFYMRKLEMELFGFTKYTLDSYNKTIINIITENISVKTRAKSNNLEPHNHFSVILDKNEC